MEFTPIAPLTLKGDIEKELLVKAEQVCHESLQLLSG